MSRTRVKNAPHRTRARARAAAAPPRAGAAAGRTRTRARARAIRFGRARCDGRAQELMLLTRSAIIRAENLPS